MLNYLRGVNIKLRTNNKINLKLIPTPTWMRCRTTRLKSLFRYYSIR